MRTDPPRHFVRDEFGQPLDSKPKPNAKAKKAVTAKPIDPAKVPAAKPPVKR